MTTRRLLLVLGLAGLIVSALSRVAVAGPSQVDVDAYAGSSVGQWTCGPTARANYGGVGGSARFYTDDQPKPRPPEDVPNAGALDPDAEEAPPVAKSEPPEEQLALEPHGFSIGAGAGGEYRDFTRIACNDTPCSPNNDAIPPGGFLGGGRAGFGYDWDYFGFRAGALAFQRWKDNNDSSPSIEVLPDVDLRFGRRAGFHGGLGFGAYNVSTTLRPGAYLSLGYASGAWAADLHPGVHLTFDGQAGVRVDAALRYGITRSVAPGIGLAVSSAEQISPEGRLFVVFTP